MSWETALEQRLVRRSATVEHASEMVAACLRDLDEAESPVAPGLVSIVLVHRMLPHVESDVVLLAAEGGTDGVLAGRLHHERRELARLIEELDLLLLDLDRRWRGQAVRRLLRRTLYALSDLLRQHQETDRALWASLRGQAVSDSGLTALLDRSEAAEREAAIGLRFLWHPPVSNTERTALADNPAVRRVLSLDEAAAAAVTSALGLDLGGLALSDNG